MRRLDVPFWWTRFARLLASAGGTLVIALTGVVRNKWLATHLDTAGIGILAQVVSGQTWIGSAAGLALSLPVARAVGQASGRGADLDAGRRAAWAAAFLTFAATSAAVAAGLLFAPAISRALLGTDEHAGLVRVSMIGVVGLAFMNPVQGVVAGRSDVRAGLTFAIAGAGGATLLAFLFVPRFGLMGAAIATAILNPLGLLGVLWLHTRRHREAIFPRPRPFVASALREAGPLLRVGGAALALGLLDLGAMVALRSHYLRAHGVDANGLLQAALALSQQVGAGFYAYFAGYAFGKINAVHGAEGTAGVRSYTRRQWTPLFVLAFLGVAIAMVAAGPLLHLLYSSRFDAARPLMAFALWGEAGRIATQMLIVGALAVGGTALWFAIGIVQPVALVAAYAWFHANGSGAASLPLAYATAGWITFAGAAVMMARRGVTLDGRGLAVAAGGFVVLAILVRFVTG
ncbi:MAG TPA: polysaccharide biosynthesis C-terminal domain-containing protein [Acidobacteriota bacterium]|nr:polysaccharide biosynthesis C-terminal domain-containing protein [Acidobacteriota bacterium]